MATSAQAHCLKRVLGIVGILTVTLVATAVCAGDIEDCEKAALPFQIVPATVVSACERAAKQGDAQAQDNLASIYASHGNSVEALKWRRMAADQGFAPAEVELGKAYELGDGLAKDYAEAAKWYRKAADQGNADARYWLRSLPESPRAPGWQPGTFALILSTYFYFSTFFFLGSWLLIPIGWAIGAVFLRMWLGLQWGRSINAALWMKLASTFLGFASLCVALIGPLIRFAGYWFYLNPGEPELFQTSMVGQPSILAYAGAGVIWAAAAAINSLVELLVLRAGWGVGLSGRSALVVFAANLVTVASFVAFMLSGWAAHW